METRLSSDLNDVAKLSPSVLTQVNGYSNDRCSKEDDVYLASIKWLFMKILLVEDDQGDCWSVEEYSYSSALLVDLAMDGQAGLCLVEVFAYDLVLLDVMLPSWI